MRIKKRFFVFIFLLIHTNTFADKLEKGFEKLKVYDYFSAKEYFEKTLEDETAAAAFGLSSIYASDKNPFYNTDSARKYILLSDSSFKSIKDKEKKYYSILGVTEYSISKLSLDICNDAFNKSKDINTSEAFNHFLKYYSTCAENSEATTLRNVAAYGEARAKNSSTAYKEFMTLYPGAVQYKQASVKYDDRLYAENTDSLDIVSNEKFIVAYPDNIHKPDAEKRIYSLSVPDKSIDQYVAFSRKYKSNKFNGDSWREAYRLSMNDFSKKSFDNFKSTYPDYPFLDELDNDFVLQNYTFLPFVEHGKWDENNWGYVNEQGDEMIKPEYDEATLFSEGLAVVSDAGKFGYINKAGKKTIKLQYKDADAFHNGNAVVLKDSLYGLINVNGEFTIQPEYEALSEVASNIFMGLKDGSYGYVRSNGTRLTEFIFDQAGDFIDGFAIVNKNEKFGLIDSTGQFNIQPIFSGLVSIGSKLFKALNENDVWGVVNVKGDTILPFLYDAVGEFNENRALVAQLDKCGYINEQGAIVIPIKFSYSSIMLTTGRFQDGYALLKQKVKSIIIDTTGKPLTISGCEDYGRLSEGLIPVKKSKKWGFAFMNGKIRIPCKFESVEPFNEGFAIIRQNKLTGLIDTTGNVFIPPLYADIVVYEKAIMVRSNGKSGVLTRTGTLLIPCSYDKIEFISPKIVRAIDPKGFTYINLENGKIIFNSGVE